MKSYNRQTANVKVKSKVSLQYQIIQDQLNGTAVHKVKTITVFKMIFLWIKKRKDTQAIAGFMLEMNQ